MTGWIYHIATCVYASEGARERNSIERSSSGSYSHATIHIHIQSRSQGECHIHTVHSDLSICDHRLQMPRRHIVRPSETSHWLNRSSITVCSTEPSSKSATAVHY